MRDGATRQAVRMQLRDAASDVLRLHARELHARIELEQGFDVLFVIAARARGKVTLMRQVLEIAREQLAAGIGLRLGRHGALSARRLG